MTPAGSRRLAAALTVFLAALVPGAAVAQSDDCAALRAEIDATGAPEDAAQADAALQRQRDEILRTRDDANRTGCGDGFFDDPDSVACRTLARRIGLLEAALQRMQDRAARGDPAGDDRRRDLRARFDAQCSVGGTDAADAPVTTVPVDPDAPPDPAARPRAGRVYCVRHCDGAFYPLAVDVAPDRMPDMDRICQAQCPAAESSAYAGEGDVAGALAGDGSTYAALPSAFQYLKGPWDACACRAPHQSWAEALAGAEALLKPQKGDVTVTAELAAAMARPAAPPAKTLPAAAKPAPAAAKKGRVKPAPALGAPVAPLPDRDLTREFRGSDPTL